MDTLDARKLVSLTLPVSKHRWLTTVSVLTRQSCLHPSSADKHPPAVLVGDRKGSVHLYMLEGGMAEPHQTLHGLHGPNGVTYSCSHQSAVYTCGRDGLCRKFQFLYSRDVGKLAELTVLKVSVLIVVAFWSGYSMVCLS